MERMWATGRTNCQTDTSSHQNAKQIRTSHWTQNKQKSSQSCLRRCLGQTLFAYHKILWVTDLQRKQIFYDTDIFRQHLACAFSFGWPRAQTTLLAKMFLIGLISSCAECVIELSLNTILTQIENREFSLNTGIKSCFSDSFFLKAYRSSVLWTVLQFCK